MDRQTFAALIAEACPTCTCGTIVLLDAERNIVGYGRIERTDRGVEITIAPPPEGVQLLAS